MRILDHRLLPQAKITSNLGYNIYFHPESDSSSWKTASGSITFDSEIVGLIWRRSNLETSDVIDRGNKLQPVIKLA
jgi:hypothetical protein